MTDLTIPSFVTCIMTLFFSGFLSSAEVETIEGEVFEATIERIDQTGTITFLDGPSSRQMSELRRIHTGRSVHGHNTGRMMLITGHGSQLETQSISITKSGMTFLDSNDKLHTTSLKHLRAVLFPVHDPGRRSSIRKEIGAMLDESISRDRVITRLDNKSITVECFVKTLDEETLTVQYEGEERTIPRKRLIAIVFPSAGPVPVQTGRAHVQKTNGTRFRGTIEGMQGGRLNVQIFSDLSIQIPWDHIVRITLDSPRIIFLSDLQPVSTYQDAIVTHPWPYKTNTNVFGDPLQTGGRRYSHGLGTHAPNQLKYNLPEKASTFAAVIGIDDATGQKGDCIFRVRGNDQTLVEKRIRGTDAPYYVRADITDYDRISLVVDAGANFDIGDNANWCDARIVRSRAQ